ncbi:MAG: hypothetical protein ABI620_04285 [Chloroflexota bacterium]
MNESPTDVTAKPSGPAAAVMIASGIGSLVIGIGVILNEYSANIKTATGLDFGAMLQFDKNFGIGSGVGALSGKVILATIAFLVSWGILHFAWRHREVSLQRAFLATMILVGLGFALTFPPVFMLFV